MAIDVEKLALLRSVAYSLAERNLADVNLLLHAAGLSEVHHDSWYDERYEITLDDRAQVILDLIRDTPRPTADEIAVAARQLFGVSIEIQAQEEVFHGMKIFDYMNDRGVRVVLDGFDKPEADFKSVRDVFEKVLEHEQKVTASINNVYSVALEVKDHAAVGFFQWFVDEQVEEEKNATDVLTKLKFVKEDSMGLLMLDKELGARPQPDFAAEAAE